MDDYYAVVMSVYEIVNLARACAVRNEDGCLLLSADTWDLWLEGYPAVQYTKGPRLPTTLARIINNTPKGLVTRHRCHRKACIEKDHLVSGTRQENSNDNKYEAFTMPLHYDTIEA